MYCRLLIILFFVQAAAAAQSPFLQKALQAERWLHTLQRQDSNGIYWPNIKDSASSTTELYSGNAGVLLFYMELYHATANKRYLPTIHQGLRHLLATLPTKPTAGNTGLYTGSAGIAYLLHQAAQATGQKNYAARANGLLQQLRGFLDTTHAKLANDIVYGYAGIGLVYLYAARHGLGSGHLATAKAIGDSLLGHALPVGGGLRWPMFAQDTVRRFFMPNFSHGTAGTAYFLACLYQRTGEAKYLTAALKAAHYLRGIAAPTGFVHHAEPNPAAMGRYYLSWCHGPPGTARLYQKLYQITGSLSWQQAVLQLADTLARCGIPEKQTPGFWNNVGYCCGSAGIAEFYGQLYQRYQNKAHWAFARHMANDLLNRAVTQADGLHWPQAENRSQPNLVQSQTGLMQGAAGIGLTLLHLHALERGKGYRVVLPDNPFGDERRPVKRVDSRGAMTVDR
jgi:lantibiotic modifying enzyme